MRGVDLESSDATSARRALSLEGVYTTLDTKTEVSGEVLEKALRGELDEPWDRTAQRGAPVGGEGAAQLRPADLRRLGALEAVILTRQAVLLGDPGSGKSTFVNHLAHALARREWDRLPGWPEQDRDLLPVRIILRDLAHQCAGSEGLAAGPKLIREFIDEDLAEQALSAAKPLLDRALEGRALVLFDGLDEVPPEQAELVKNAILSFRQRYSKNRYLATCRVLSYQQADWRLPAEIFADYELAPFDGDKIDHFVEAWYTEVAAKWQVPVARTRELVGKLKTAVRRPDLWLLAPNPLLLTVMALVHTYEGELPEARAKLYEKAVNILLWRWENEKLKEQGGVPRLLALLQQAGRGQDDLRGVLEELAFQVHGEGGDAAHSEKHLAGISEWALLQALCRIHPNTSLDWGREVADTVKKRAGLLIEREGRVFAFPHRIFQEYLAGIHLARQQNFARTASSLIDQGGFWREVVYLAAGFLVHNVREYEKPVLLAAALCPEAVATDDAGWRKAVLAGDILIEVGLHRLGDTGKPSLERIRSRLLALVEEGALGARERLARISRAPCKGTVFQRVRTPPGNFRSSR